MEERNRLCSLSLSHLAASMRLQSPFRSNVCLTSGFSLECLGSFEALASGRGRPTVLLTVFMMPGLWRGVVRSARDSWFREVIMLRVFLFDL